MTQTLRTKTVVIKEEKGNRDSGKKYLITEMPAEPAEIWAFRVLQGALEQDIDIDFSAPLAQLASEGIKIVLKSLARMDHRVAKELMDQLMSRVQVVLPDGNSRALIPNSTDIMEVSTRAILKKEVLALQLGFFMNGGE